MTNRSGTGDEDPIDLGLLGSIPEDPGLDAHIRRIRLAATPELVRRQAMRNPVGIIVRWARPILAASSILALFAVLMLVQSHRHAASPENRLERAMGVPAALVPWISTGERPTAGELLEIAED